jgi:hypothetical protein
MVGTCSTASPINGNETEGDEDEVVREVGVAEQNKKEKRTTTSRTRTRTRTLSRARTRTRMTDVVQTK